ncbi:UNVERIFIED_CONTAM: hypothetical protein ITH36_25415, partial [Salmonella enterica subsp. enterica serovar Weltevreden]
RLSKCQQESEWLSNANEKVNGLANAKTGTFTIERRVTGDRSPKHKPKQVCFSDLQELDAAIQREYNGDRSPKQQQIQITELNKIDTT